MSGAFPLWQEPDDAEESWRGTEHPEEPDEPEWDESRSGPEYRLWKEQREREEGGP